MGYDYFTLMIPVSGIIENPMKSMKKKILFLKIRIDFLYLPTNKRVKNHGNTA